MSKQLKRVRQLGRLADIWLQQNSRDKILRDGIISGRLEDHMGCCLTGDEELSPLLMAVLAAKQEYRPEKYSQRELMEVIRELDVLKAEILDEVVGELMDSSTSRYIC